MRTKNFYLLLIALLAFSFTSCKKEPSSGNNSGNVPAAVDPPAGSNDGVTFLNSGKSVIFNLYAPKKSSAAVIGEFNNWQPTAMKNSKDGSRWWIEIDNLDPSKEYSYQYLLDGTLKVADPYTEKILDPDNDNTINSSAHTVYPNLKAYPTGATTGIVSTFWANQPVYNWQVTNFKRPDPKNLVVYEMLVRDFVATHDYKTIKDTLNYIVNLGVNAIELMPISEFEGNSSWGYNPDFYFAPDKYYGTKNDLKALIDACHAKGIAVIQDIVLNHSFGSSPMVQMYFSGTPSAGAPTADNPWYNTAPTHPANVGFQFNHESAATKYFVKSVLKWWMQEYHIDGFRFDLAKGFTQTNSGTTDYNKWAQYDASRVAIWKDYNNYMKSVDPNIYVILEYFAGNQEESELADQGMMTWTNLSTPGEQATMGYNDSGGSWDISGLFYDGYGFKNPYALVAYFESHDQERLQFKNGAYGNSNSDKTYSVMNLPTGLKRDEMGAAFMFSSPGPKMVYEFGERGYDVSLGGDAVKLNFKEPHWEYMLDPNRHHLYATYAKMIKWKINNPVFTTSNFKYDLGNDAFKWIQLIGTDGTDVMVVGNFGVVNNTATLSFPATGTWTDNIDGSSINVTGAVFTMTLAPGEYHVYSNTPLH